MSLCASRVCKCPQGAEEGIKFHGNGVRGSCEPQYIKCWKHFQAPLQNQYALLSNGLLICLYFLFILKFLYYVSECLPTWMYVYRVCLVPWEATGSHKMPWNWRDRWL